MNRLLPTILIVVTAFSCTQRHTPDLNAPFGWAVCTSRDDAGSYDLTGGARSTDKAVEGSKVTLVSDGSDMRDAIIEAVRNFDTIVLDGSAGEFIISRTMEFDSLRNKTIVGINDARLRSEFQTSPEFFAAIEGAAEKYKDSPLDEDGRYTLSNGDKISARQYGAFAARQALLEHFGDDSEQYAHSGMFTFSSSENLIIRNLTFEGTGTFRGMAEHLIRIRRHTNHVWIDHCLFLDASRCAIAFCAQSDFLTVSWCRICCTERSGDHTLGMLISSDDFSYEDEGYLNATLAFNQWDNIWTRVPMARFGDIHVLNCLYSNPGTVGINPRMHSQFLIEGCWFESGVRAFCPFKVTKTPPRAYCWRDNFSADGERFEDGGEKLSGNGVSMPYAYNALPPAKAREAVLSSAGPTLRNPLKISR